MTADRSIEKGIFFAALSVLCWGTLFPAVSFLMRRGNVDACTMAQMRFLVAGSVMLVCYAFFQKKMPWRPLEKSDFAKIFFQSVFAAGMSVFLFYGQSLGIPVVNASMLEAEAPLMIFLLSIVILRIPSTWLQGTGLLLGFSGCLLVLKVITLSGIELKSFSTGDVMVFLGAACWALYTVLSHRAIKRIGGFLYTAWSLLSAGIWILLFQLTLALPFRYPVLGPDIGLELYLALIPTALAFFAWNNAQKYISPGFLGISGYFTPAITAVFGWLFFAEKLTVLQYPGMVLVVCSALIEPEIAGTLHKYFSERANFGRSN